MRSTILILSICLGVIGANAQGAFVISYPISFPMGNLHDYTSSTSFRGVSLEWLKKISPNMQTGIEVGWNTFYQHQETQAYHQGTATITGSQYRYTNVAPILAGAKYYPGAAGKKKSKPFVGFGLGTLYANRSTDFGLYRITNEAWQFCMRPELGIELNAGSGVSGFLAAKYYWAFNTHDLDGQSFLSINIGIKASAF